MALPISAAVELRIYALVKLRTEAAVELLIGSAMDYWLTHRSSFVLCEDWIADLRDGSVGTDR